MRTVNDLKADVRKLLAMSDSYEMNFVEELEKLIADYKQGKIPSGTKSTLGSQTAVYMSNVTVPTCKMISEEKATDFINRIEAELSGFVYDKTAAANSYGWLFNGGYKPCLDGHVFSLDDFYYIAKVGRKYTDKLSARPKICALSYIKNGIETALRAEELRRQKGIFRQPWTEKKKLVLFRIV